MFISRRINMNVVWSALSSLAFLLTIYGAAAFRVAPPIISHDMANMALYSSLLGEISLMLCRPRRGGGSEIRLLLLEFFVVAAQIAIFALLPRKLLWMALALVGVVIVSRRTLLVAFPLIIWRSLPVKNGSLLPTCFVFLLSSLLLVANPLMVYARDPINFGDIWMTMLAYGVWVSLGLSLLVAIVAHFARNTRFCGVCTWLLLSAVLCVLFYHFLIPSNFGSLQGAQLMDAEAMLKPWLVYYAEFVLLVFLCAVAWLLQHYIPNDILVSVSLTLVFALNLMGILPCALSSSAQDNLEASNSNIPSIRVSSSSPNVFVFLLDMVQGASFKHIMDDPNIASRLDGFIWCPNSISVSQFTLSSVPAIFGGSDGDPARLNEDTTDTVSAKGRRLAKQLQERLKTKGYVCSFHAGDARHAKSWCDETQVYDRGCLCRMLGTGDYFYGSDFKPVLWGNSLLHAVPFAFKPFVYSGGSWRSNRTFQPFARDHMLYQALVKLSRVENGSKGNFHLFDAQLTHNPWGIPDENGLFKQVDSIQILKWTIGQICNYIEWLRKEGVYDNTRIIIVSDHGLTNIDSRDPAFSLDPMRHKELWGDLVEGCSDRWGIESPNKIQAFNNLLVFKDFGAHSPLRSNDHLVSNSDVEDIIFCENVGKYIDALPSVRKAYLISWPEPKNNVFDILAAFRVKDNMFDLGNWSRIK